MITPGREQAVSMLQAWGYDVTSHFKFCARGERTPSALVNSDGTIHDFGSGWHGDLIDFLKDHHSMSFNEAKALVVERIGGQTNLLSPAKYEDKKVKIVPIKEEYLRMHKAYARRHPVDYEKELKDLFTGKVNGATLSAVPSFEAALEVAKKFEIGFIDKTKRLVMPIRDLTGRAMTLWKYKKHPEEGFDPEKHAKVLFTKDRPRPPLLGDTRGDVIVVTEGEKDLLVATANGLHAICIGGAGTKSIPDTHLMLFKGKEVIVAGDYDEAGEFFNYRITSQLLGFNKQIRKSEFEANKEALFNELLEAKETPNKIASKVTILDWEKKAANDGFELCEKFDLADYFAWKNQINN
jgi:DNA primase